ncbi:RDD family protein [Wukongibacter baidiensis]|uniref:RDD family protein n=1 Tax=Wukongibacter baidiensis TaxID=1723361 RepID=UPI003D7FA5F8
MKLQFKRVSTTGERLISFLLDHLIVCVLFMIGIIGIISIFDVTSDEASWIFGIPLFLGIPLIYGLKDIFNGRSIGKRAFSLGVRCVENPDEVPDKWRLFLRNITIVIWPIEFFIIIFNSKGMRLGDMLAKTIVVKLEKESGEYNEALEEFKAKYENTKPINNKKVIKIIVVIVVIFVIMTTILISGIFGILKNSGAYKATITQIENDQEVALEVGEIKGYGVFPSGSISTSDGYGKAEFVIKVKGEKRDIKVKSKLHKVPNSEWKIDEYYIMK